MVVEPTHLKNMLVKLGSSSPNRDENKRYLSCHHPVFLPALSTTSRRLPTPSDSRMWPPVKLSGKGLDLGLRDTRDDATTAWGAGLFTETKKFPLVRPTNRFFKRMDGWNW